MKVWPLEITALTRAEIMEHIKDDVWQAARINLKGQSTEHKLQWLYYYVTEGDGSRAIQVRVDNYINALLRGGQLMRTKTNLIVVQR